MVFMRPRSIAQGAHVKSFFLFFLLILAWKGQAQDRCGVVEYTEQLRNKKSLLESNSHFEEWLNAKVAQRRAGRTNAAETNVPRSGSSARYP